MAPYIPFFGGVQANVRFTLFGVPGEYVLNFHDHAGDFNAAAVYIFNALDTQWWPTLRASIGGGFLLTEAYFIDLSAQDGSVISLTDWTNPAPGSANPALPGNVAFCVTHRTAQRGRAYRGRTYVAGLNEAAVSGNNVQPTDRDVCVEAFNLLRITLAPLDIDFAVASRRLNGVPRTEGVLTPVTVSVAVDDRTDSQRRRLS